RVLAGWCLAGPLGPPHRGGPSLGFRGSLVPRCARDTVAARPVRRPARHAPCHPQPTRDPLPAVRRDPRSLARGHAAFSLVELLISMAILSVGLVGAMRVFPMGLRASLRAEQQSRAALAAQRTIESLKLEPWEALEDGETTAEEDGFDVTTRISQPDPEALVDASRLKALEVRVRFVQDGRPRELTFLTYVRRETS
ncbi:MAG: prepilin-type N-terminal cleavage/methylation domain-containing protein, partial [Candidatus Omnitrophica bacterium]|nr:prepilin-type N-terminal cleavage/methylation domain-containing protein [Candidatus Omnitrophota bacterium]